MGKRFRPGVVVVVGVVVVAAVVVAVVVAAVALCMSRIIVDRWCTIRANA